MAFLLSYWSLLMFSAALPFCFAQFTLSAGSLSSVLLPGLRLEYKSREKSRKAKRASSDDYLSPAPFPSIRLFLSSSSGGSKTTRKILLPAEKFVTPRVMENHMGRRK